MAACCFDPCAPVFGESAFKGAVPCKRLTTIKPTAVSELTHLNRISLIFLVGSDTRPVTESPGASIHGPLFLIAPSGTGKALGQKACTIDGIL